MKENKKTPDLIGLFDTFGVYRGRKLTSCVTLFSLLAVMVISFVCSKDPKDAIIGTWVLLDNQYGIVERTFNRDNTVITKYYLSFDYETTEKYDIIDNILFIDNNANEVYNESYPFYFTDKKLVLPFSYYGSLCGIYEKKTGKQDIEKLHTLLIGNWEGSKYENAMKYAMNFQADDTVIIKEYDKQNNLVNEDYYIYELNGYYIFIKDINRKNSFSENFNRSIMVIGRYVYKINEQTLIMKAFSDEVGLIASMFLSRKGGMN